MQDLRKQVLKRHEALKKERESWLQEWKEIARLVMPSTGRFLTRERNTGRKEFNKILDNEATRSVRILGAGLMSGMTSPARPWFRLATTDKEMMREQPVKEWLDEVTKIIHTIFHRSNVYNALHSIYEELAVYGTAACVMEADYHNVIHLHALTAGEYCIATNPRGEADTLYREFDLTVGQLVEMFGKDKCSQTVQSQYDNGNVDEWVTVIHAIEPRRNYDHKRRDNKNMPWRSVYLEKGANHDDVLRESGYQRFPALAPRWQVSGGDIYGTSPSMEALGDIRQLQHQQTRKGQAIDYQVRPPLRLPSALKNYEADVLPGGIVYSDDQSAIQPLWQVGIDLQHLLADMQDVRQRISRAYYADLFLMMTQTDNRMTATEVAERHEEKMLMLGPVLERLQNELIKPLVDFAFYTALAGGILPEPPEELAGQDLDIQLVSILAQAQISIQTNSIDRFVTSVATFAQIKPEALDRVDVDALVDVYSDALGVDAKLIVSKEQADEIRQQRAEQEQQMQQAQMQQQQMAQMADMAQKLGNTPMGQGSALDGVMEGLSGYS